MIIAVRKRSPLEILEQTFAKSLASFSKDLKKTFKNFQLKNLL